MRKNTERVFRAWIEDRPDIKDRSIWTDGRNVYSYGTCIIAVVNDSPERKAVQVVLNTTKYNHTTSTQVSGLRGMLRDNFDIVEVDNMPIASSPERLIKWSSPFVGPAVKGAS